MAKNKRITLIVVYLFSAACNNEPLFDQMYEQRIILFMKGTYSSNDSKPFNNFGDDNSVQTKGVPISTISKLYLDLAQIGLTKSKKADERIPDDAVRKLSDDRQLFYFKYENNPVFVKEELFNRYDLEDPNLKQSQINRLAALRTRQNAEFFHDAGYGVRYKGQDIKAGEYDKFRLFVRRIITDNAVLFNRDANGNLSGEPIASTTRYNNDIIAGHEISDYYRFYPDEVDSLTAKNFLFPYTLEKKVNIPSYDPLHIEFRLHAKNSMKAYEMEGEEPYETENGDGYSHAKFWAFADFYTNFLPNAKTMLTNFNLGLHVYNPMTAGKIRGSVPQRFLQTNGNLQDAYYIAVVPNGANAPSDYIPDMATGTARNGIFTIHNVAAGYYDVYIMQDINSSANEDERDGFPETVVDKPISVYVGESMTMDISFE